MPLAQERVSSDTVNFSEALTSTEVDMLAGDSTVRVLQTSSPVDTETWRLLNERLFAKRHGVQLRVYGFYSSVCDLSFLVHVRNVRHFTANCLKDAKGIAHLAELRHLQSLAIGIYSLDNFDFLADIPRTLCSLSLEATRSKRPRLNHLERFQDLRTLYIEGQQKQIEVISTLAALEDLTLRSVSPSGLDFISNLRHLWSLDIKLGGIRSLSALEGMDGIKYLELWQVKGLSDIIPVQNRVRVLRWNSKLVQYG